MNQERAPIQRDPARARRQTAGLVAQYIHELSQRHADARQAISSEQPSPERREAEGD
jgi:hypothetical protein